MLLAIDIGNSAIKFGIFSGAKLVEKFSLSTKNALAAPLTAADLEPHHDNPIDRAIVCSVVPDLDAAVRAFVGQRFGIDVVFVGPQTDFGLTINYQPLESLGADRLVNAFAAASKYGTPVIICSLGTATTVDGVTENGEFLGGAIAPGITAMARSLNSMTAMLPYVEIERPASAIGHSTAASIESGVYFGYLGLVNELVTRVKNEAGFGSGAKIIVTGGASRQIAADSTLIDICDENLMLDGLRLAAERLMPQAKS